MSFNMKEQIPKLFDNEAFTEIFSGFTNKEPDTVVRCGSGKVGGSHVYFFVQNTSIKAMDILKLIKFYKLILKNPAPIVGFYNASSMDMSKGIELLNDYGELLSLQAELSGKVLQTSVIVGECIGINGIMASLADTVIMADDAKLYPTPIGQTISKDIGSAKTNAALGVVQAVVAASTIIEKTRTMLDTLINHKSEPADCPDENTNEITSNLPINNILDTFFDKNSNVELYKEFGKGTLTAFARLEGKSVCVVATNGRTIKADDAVKIARTLQLADTLNIPVVTFLNSEGLDNSDTNSTRDFAKLACMYSKATIPKFVVCAGKAYGAAYIVIAGKGSNTSLVLAWDNATITPLPPETAVAFMKADIISMERSREKLVEEYINKEASAEKAASVGVVDTVIKPEDTRSALIEVFNSIEIPENNNKKYGNIPF